MFIAVHPCDNDDKNGCEQTCTKKGEEAVCECGPGFILNVDGKKCDPGMVIESFRQLRTRTVENQTMVLF